MVNIDSDLKFLFDCSNEQLKLLCDTLTHDPKDQRPRYTEQLSTTASYRAYYPHDMRKIVRAIVDEYSRFGGNTIANLLRGRGVPYKEILRDVCGSFDIKVSKADSVDTLEAALLKVVVRKMADKLAGEAESDAALGELMSDMELFCKDELQTPTRLFSFLLLANAPRLTGAYLVRYVGGQITWRLALGPWMWIVGSAWALSDIAAPAFRVTIPATIIVACLRRVQNTKIEDEFKVC